MNARSLAAAACGLAGLGIALFGPQAAPASTLALLAGLFAGLLVASSSGRSAEPEQIMVEPRRASLDARELIEAVGEPLLVIEQGRVAAANQAARFLLGEEIERRDIRLVIRHPAAAEILLGTDDPAPGGIELVGLGASDQPWLMTVRPLGAGGRLVHLADLGESRAAERMRTDFVANASHELRTPLATISGFIETLEDEEASGDPAVRHRFLGIMAEEAKRMRSLIDDLMSLSRIEAERFAAPTDPVDMRQVAGTAVESLRRLADSRGIAIELTRETESTIVAGDSAQLLQLLSNLVSNAVHHSNSRGAINVRLADSGANLLLVEVADTGIGIGPEHVPRLTERFYRVDAGRSRAAGGTGLGLAIAKHVALRHRGRLEIESRVGEGTKVRVLLPRIGES